MIRHFLFSVGLLVLLLVAASPGYASMLVGRGMADVTGPAWGNPMWGFARPDQKTEGLHHRLKSRAFIIAREETGNRLVFVTVDIGSIEHHVTLAVIDKLQAVYGDIYSLDNVMLSATHTHSGPAGYWHTRVEFALSGKFYQKHFDHIVDGITDSIMAAHEDLQSTTIAMNKGKVEGVGANRSMTAYLLNPAEERALYDSAMEQEMTLLRFDRAEKSVGLLNWFGLHPTSMTFDNHLISGDHKGYAALSYERMRSTSWQDRDDFIAAFAQTTPGDVTPNINMDNTGPGANDMESTRIIGDRQRIVAENLFETAGELLDGPVQMRWQYVDMSAMGVTPEFTHAGHQETCPSAYGYAFGAGSSEDGGCRINW